MTTSTLSRGQPEPLGVYVHVPFCRVHCPYCDFYTYPTSRGRELEYGRALLHEIDLVDLRLRREAYRVESVYFGGGTPSTLPPDQLHVALERLGAYLRLAPEVEVTLEANPEDVSETTVEPWKELGVTRLSLGVQTLDAERLNFLGRIHSADTARRALAILSRQGNWSADLMFGWEGQRVQQLEADLGELLAFGPPHVSLYQLTLEPRTRLGVLAARDLVHCADADRQADLYLAACEVLDRAGLRQYEVSNFARPGFESRHNQAYWERRAYLGLGPSAASLVCERRTRNVASLPRYLEAVSAGRSPVDFVEVLTPEKAALESLWLGLRTSRGVPAETIDPDHWPMLRQAERDELLTTGGDGRIALTRKGMAVADGLVLRLLPTAKVDKCACRI